VNEEAEAFRGDASRLAGTLDVVFVPLGLAYGKLSRPMKLFETFLQTGIAKQDTTFIVRCVAALGVVGFHYPEAVFELLRPLMTKPEGEVRKALVGNLAIVRTLHFDAVDQFLGTSDVAEELRHDIDAATDVELVRRYIKVLGYYNNSVHLSLRYPKMRRTFSTGALKLLVTTRSPSQFISEYTGAAMSLLQEADYDVLKWTLPD
jgi:hypothetical protein